MTTIPRHASPLIVIRIASILMVFLVPSLLILLSWGSIYQLKQTPGHLAVAKTSQKGTNSLYDKFMLEEFSITGKDVDEERLTLSAKQLIHRKRKSQFFVYQNLKEIYLHDTQINFFPPNDTTHKAQLEIPVNNQVAIIGQMPHDSAHKARLEIPFELIGKNFESFGPIKPTVDEFLSGNSDIDLDIVSRVIFEGLSIRIALPDKKQISIQADLALMPTDFSHLVFTGNVRLESGTGQLIVASQAVWSCKDRGFFFPNGHTLENRQDNDPAFYDVMLSGALLRQNPTLVVDYADPLETKEKELQEHIAKRMPIYARLIFGLPLNP